MLHRQTRTSVCGVHIDILERLTSAVGTDGLGEVGESFVFYLKYFCAVEYVTESIRYFLKLCHRFYRIISLNEKSSDHCIRSLLII